VVASCSLAQNACTREILQRIPGRAEMFPSADTSACSPSPNSFMFQHHYIFKCKRWTQSENREEEISPIGFQLSETADPSPACCGLVMTSQQQILDCAFADPQKKRVGIFRASAPLRMTPL
jgi:hypothetical protein